MDDSDGDRQAIDPGTRAATEAWFRRRGLPHLIEGYSVRRDALTRAVKWLVVVFVLQMFNAVDLDDRGPVLNALTVAGALGILLGGWSLVNLARGRPALARPRSVGPVEAGVFVLLPALPPLVFGGRWMAAAVTATVNGTILMLLAVGYSYALGAIIRWGGAQVVRQLNDVLATVVRALPLLLLFVTFLFLNAEAWQVTSRLDAWGLATVGGLLVVVGVGFAVLRLPRQIGELAEAETWSEARAHVVDTPVEHLADRPEPATGPPTLARRQWGNVGLVVLVSEAIQILIVTAFVFAFLGLLGVLAVDPAVVARWTGFAPDVLATLTLGDRELVLTAELLRVAAFLAVFSGLYFTVALLTDRTYREEFLDELVAEVRQAFAVRAVYLAATSATPTGIGGPSSTLSGT